jgi:lysophospholipase
VANSLVARADTRPAGPPSLFGGRLPALLDIPANPPPRGAIVASVAADDGVELRTARWLPNRSPVRGTVLIIPGRAEFIEKYFETVADLRRRGFAVAIFDPRGQGGSARLLKDARKGHVRDFADHANDLETFMQEVVLPDCPPPYYILAHSTGALVALLTAERLKSQIDRMVLTAPLIALTRGAPEPVARFTGALAYFGLGEVSLPRRIAGIPATPEFEHNPLTSDPERFQRTLACLAAEPALGIGPATIGWLNAAMRACLALRDAGFGAKVPIPSLLVLAGSDTVVDNRAAEEFSSRVRAAAYLRIPAARHEILMERDALRDQFWIAFDAFIAGRR